MTTHNILNRQALAVLRNDGFLEEASLLSVHLRDLNRGSLWVDYKLRNVRHFFDPVTHCGLWPWPSALETFYMHFDEALVLWRNDCWSHAAFHLGASMHLVQDMCVPHHSRCRILDGHREFESEAHRLVATAFCRDGGDYSPNAPEAAIVENATFSRDFPLELPKKESLAKGIMVILLQRAQKTGAGLLQRFCELAMCSSLKPEDI